MDHVEQDRAGTDLTAPRSVGEIVVGLEEHRAAHHGDERLAWADRRVDVRQFRDGGKRPPRGI